MLINEKGIRDIALAAFLTAQGHPLERVLREGARGVFWFTFTEELQKDELRYLNHQASVEPQQFLSNVRHLKAAIPDR